MAVVEDSGEGAHRDAAPDHDAADLHDAVLVEVGLERGRAVDRGKVADLDAVELGDVGHQQAGALAHLHAEEPQHPGQERRAHQVLQQHLAGESPIGDGDRLGPHRPPRPHRPHAGAVASHQEPFERDDAARLDQRDGEAHEHEGKRQPAPILGEDGGVEHPVDRADGERDVEHRRERGGEGLEQAAPQLGPHARLEGLGVGAEIDLLADRQADRRRAEPRLARPHLVVGRRLRLDADQHVVGDVRARRQHAVIADEDAGAGLYGMEMHPAAADLLLADHHLVGDEVVGADRDEVVARAEIGRDLGAPSHPRAHQPVPRPHVDGGEERGERFQRHLGGERHQPFAQVEARPDREGAVRDPRQHRPADGGDEQHRARRHQHGGGPGQQRQVDVVIDVGEFREVIGDLVEEVEGREDRQQADRRHRREQEGVDRTEGRPAGGRGGGRFGQGSEVHGADPAAGRAVPGLSRADFGAGRHGGEVGDLGMVSDHRAGADHAGGADGDILADLDGADDEFVADDLRVGDHQPPAERRAAADGEQIGCADIEVGDQHVVADPRAEQAQIGDDDGRALEPLDVHQRRQALRQPPAVIIDAPERVAAGLRPPENQPFGGNRDRRGDRVDADIDQQENAEFAPEAEPAAGEQQVGDEDAEPLRGGQRDDEGQSDRLRQSAERPAQQRRRSKTQVADRGLGAGPARALDQTSGHHPQGAAVIDVLKGDAGERRGLAHRTDEAGSEQRVAAELGEEVGLEPDRTVAEHLFRRRQQSGLGLVVGGLLLAVGHRHGQRRDPQRLAIDLAGGEPRQGLDRLEMAGHHVGRHLRREILSQRRAVEIGAAFGHEEGDEAVDLVVAAQDHRRLIDPVLRPDARLDLAELHAEPADLDLIVDAAVEDDVALRRHRDGVARAVEHRIGPVGRVGVGDELFRRQLGPFEIARRDAGAADQQLALFARREEVERLVGDVNRIIRDRAADGDGPARPHLGGGRHHGGFGRAVGVEQAPPISRPARHQRLGQGLAAEQHEADTRQVAGDHGEQGRDRVEHGDPGLRDDRGQGFDVAHHGRARHEQAGADEIGNPDLLHREIEGDGGALEHHVVGGEAVDRVARAQEVADVGVADDDALRHAGRARGVDQVGRVLRTEAGGIEIGR